MNFKQLKNKRSKSIFVFSIFVTIYTLINVIYVKASIIDNIINLFTSSSSKKSEVKYSLSTNDLLKPGLTSTVKEETEDDGDSNFDISDNGIIKVQSGPLRISTEKEKQINDSIILYEVKEGDTLDTVADLFDVSKNTIVWANNLKTKKLTPGENLLIFPVTGISYTAKNNISLEDVAKKYNADADEIAVYNGISKESKLAKGDSIFIPDAEAEIQTEVKPNKSKTTPIAKKQPKYKNNAVAGYFMKPVSGCILTQGLHGPYTTATDWGCPVGTPTVAAASGVVIRSVLEGYNGGYGGVIIVSHPNGTQSIYAHMNSISVTVGQKVKQGQVIGTTGNTGRSTGPHLHFETRGTRNPFG